MPYDWVAGEPIAVGVTSSTGIETVKEIAGGGRDATAVGAGLPRLRDHRLPRRRAADRARPALAAVAPARRRKVARRVHGADRRPADVPRASRRCSRRSTSRRPSRDARRAGPRAARGGAQLPDDDVRLRADVTTERRRLRPRARRARGGRHRPPQSRRGPRHRHLVRRRRADARDVPDRRLHDPQPHRGTRHRRTARRGGRAGADPAATLVGLALIAGAPAILGAWIGGYSGSDVLAVSSSRPPRAPRCRSWSRSTRFVARRAPAGSPRATRSAASSPGSR